MALNVKSSETVVIPEASDLADVSTTRTYFAGSLQKHRAGAHSHDISVGVAVALIFVLLSIIDHINHSDIWASK